MSLRRSRTTPLLLLTVAGALAWACSDDADEQGGNSQPANGCVPGQSVACVGENACNGHQVCASSGTEFGPCQCAGGSGGASNTDSATGGIAGSVASGGTAGGVAQDAAIDSSADSGVPDAAGNDDAASDAAAVGCPTKDLFSVAVLSPTDVWVAGETVHHYDGTSWIEHPVTSPQAFAGYGMWLEANAPWVVSSKKPGDVTWDGPAEVIRWDGLQWQQLPQPGLTGPPYYQNGRAIWGASATNVWVGGGGVARWNGSAWQKYTLNKVPDASLPYAVPGQGFVHAIHGTSSNDVWIVGAYEGWNNYNDLCTIAIAWHFDGVAVSNVYQPGWSCTGVGGSGGTPLGVFRSVRAFAPNDVWVSNSTHAYRLTGGPFTQVDDGGGLLWGTSSSDVWALSDKQVKHYAGTKFDVDPTLPTPPALVSYQAMHGSSSSNVWVVGNYGTIARYNGTSWSLVCPGNPPQPPPG